MEVACRLSQLQAVDNMREALRVSEERCHNIVHKAHGEIAVVNKVRVVILVRLGGKLLVHLARLLVCAKVVEHEMGIVVIGIDQYAVLRLGERQPLYIGLLCELALVLFLRKYHHQRHFVEAGAVVPLVRIIKPGLARGCICIGDAYLVGLYAL